MISVHGINTCASGLAATGSGTKVNYRERFSEANSRYLRQYLASEENCAVSMSAFISEQLYCDLVIQVL
jgi:hypothetical protein